MRGAACLALSLLSLLIPRGSAAAPPPPPESLAVVVGADLGDESDEPLRFAASDARRMGAALEEVGVVPAGRVTLVTRGGPAALVEALERARQQAEALAARGASVTFYFYYSGHGDERALHLAGGTQPIDDLRRRIAAVPARLRITFLDACRTGGRTRGIARGPRFAVEVAPDLPSGQVEVRASANGEAAQESEELGGAVFSHFLVSGLRGAADADRDGAVTLAELYAYVYRRTLLRTGERAPVVQHPELRAAIAGSGEIVVGRPSSGSRALEVPPDEARYLVFSWPSGAAVGELTGSEGTRLSLPPGRYLVVRRAGSAISAAEITLAGASPSGGARRLGPGEFRSLSREELVARGGAVTLHPTRIELRAAFEALPGAADALGVAGAVAVSHSRGRWVLGGEIGYAGAGIGTDVYGGWRHAVTAAGEVGLRWFPGRLTVGVALGVEARLGVSQLHARQAARTTAAGFAADERRVDFGAGPRATVRLGLPLGDRLSLGPFLSIGALLRRESDGDTAGIAARPVLDLGAALSVQL